MPQIIPIKELKNTAAVSEPCHSTTEPIFTTKMDMGMETYEEAFLKLKLYQELEISEHQLQEGKVMDAKDSLARLKEKYE